MFTRVASFAVWALVAASVVFWGLRIFVRAPGAPAQSNLPVRTFVAGGDYGRLLGVTRVAVQVETEPEAPPEADRFKLLGVVSPPGGGTSSQGLALIAVDDQPARTWRSGSTVDGDTVLLSVSKRGAMLGPRGGPPTIELTLPEPVSASNGDAPSPPPRMQPMRPLPTQPHVQQPGNPRQATQDAGGGNDPDDE